MADAPIVSVVIPCYNHGHYLAEAVASVGAPGVSTEIVVIDDGSTDSTAGVMSALEASGRVRAVRQANGGLAAARNRGLRESRGRYLVFLDADDRLAPGAVDLGAASLDEHRECAFVFGRCVMMDRDGRLLITREQPRIERDHYRELLRRNYIWMPAMVAFRREPLERIGGFNGSVNAAADYEVYLHLARHHPIHDHARVVAHYRKHDANMSGDGARMLRETLTVMKSQRPFLAGDAQSRAAYEEGWRAWQEFYGAHLATEIRAAVRDGRWMRALVKSAALGRYHPRGLWHHARRKAEVTIGAAPSTASEEPHDPDQAGRAMPAAEISAPTERASSSPGRR